MVASEVSVVPGFYEQKNAYPNYHYKCRRRVIYFLIDKITNHKLFLSVYFINLNIQI